MKNIVAKYWKILIGLVVIIGMVLSGLGYQLGLTKDWAKDKVIRESIDLSPNSQFKYGFSKVSKIDLISRANLDNPFMYAGLIAGAHINSFNTLINNRINANEELNLIGDIAKKEANIIKVSSCNTLLGFVAEIGTLGEVKTLLDKAKITNKNDCAYESAIKGERKEVIELLSKNEFSLTNEQKSKLIKGCYAGLAYSNVISDIGEILSCKNQTLLNNYTKLLNQEEKNNALKQALSAGYSTAIDALLANKADINSINLTKSEILTKAIELKSDGLFTLLIQQKYPIPNNIAYVTNGVAFSHDPFVFTTINNMNFSAQTLLNDGYNPNSKYSPELNSSTQLPVLFATIAGSNKTIQNTLLTKYNVLQNFNDQEKEKIVAFAIDTFESKADKDSLDIFKNLIDSGLSIYTKLIYVSSDNYQTKEYPVWAQAYIKNLDIYPAAKMDERKEIYDEYFNFIKDKNFSANFKYDNYSPMYLALTARSKKFTEFLINNSNVNIQFKIKDDEDYDGINKIIANNDLSLLDYILIKNPDLNKINASDTYITYTLINPNLDRNSILKKLLEKGANPKLCPTTNRCPKDLVQGVVLDNSIVEKF